MTTPILHLPVWEPAGRDVVLTQSDLHLLIIGATGSGKTVILHRIMEQLIRRPCLGLLIVDAKEDDTVERVRSLAAAAGRLQQVVVLGPSGDHYIDLFGPLKSIRDVDFASRRLLLAAGTMGKENLFWEESRAAMIDAALTLLVAQGGPIRFTKACEFMSNWFFRPELTPRVSTVLASARQMVGSLTGPEKQKLRQALDMAEMWRALDGRTRSNIASTLACVVKPLLGVPAAGCFQSGGRKSFDPGELIRASRICIASLNATTDPGLASLFFRLVKTDFFREVQSQKQQMHPLCGMVADEWPLLASIEDVEALATVRSRGCFVVAATQGLAAIDERLGTRMRKAMMTNFGTLVFLRSREEEVDLLAAVHLGTKKRRKAANTYAEGELIIQEKPKSVYEELICPPGTLGRLSPHQGFVAAPGSPTCELPRTFIPWYEDCNRPTTPFADHASPEYMEQILARCGFTKQLAGDTFSKAIEILSADVDYATVLSDARGFFQSCAILTPDGLECVPAPWLAALPRILWATRKASWTHLPYMLKQVEVASGLLLMRYAQEEFLNLGARITSFDRLRIVVNASLYPNLYRPLKPRHLEITA